MVSACSTLPGVSTPLPLGLPTAAPSGYVVLCAHERDQCPAKPANGPTAVVYEVPRTDGPLTPDRWLALDSVNREVNRRVRYVTDQDRFGQPDVWEPATTEGDCEDYALAKRQMLWAAGWSPSELSLALVQSPQTGPHAVLIANTAQGAYVLDNANNWVLPWSETNYTWVTAQDADGQWRVAGANAQAVLLAEAAAERGGMAPAGLARQQVANLSAKAAQPAGSDASGRQVPDLGAMEPGSR